MAEAITTNSVTAPSSVRLPTQWIGVAPFFIFVVLFLILPTMYLIVGAFQDRDGGFTLANIFKLFEQPTTSASPTWSRSR